MADEPGQLHSLHPHCLRTIRPAKMVAMYENLSELLDSVPRHTRSWFKTLANRPVRATASSDQLRETLGGPLPLEGTAPEAVIEALANAGATGTVASAGPRYFGFVVGGTLPAALAADWLVSTWDQNAGIFALSPLASTIEQITGSWLREIAGLPSTMSFGFVTGGHMANFTSLACARHSVLRKAGWDVEANGLFGAPPVEVFVNEESHYTIFIALRLLGLGANRVRKIPADDQGRMRADLLAAALRETSGPSIVCAQAGNVNTGAFDPLPAIADAAKERGAWLHVDGAFGLWAAASPQHAHLVHGIERADSVASDAHKWLNVPTTAASSSAPTKPRTAAPCPLPRRISLPPAPSAIPMNSSPKNPAAPAPSPSTPHSARSAAAVLPK
jgi:glutamate/tyrosine decarboxylase-like PLP-dependent enzyme